MPAPRGRPSGVVIAIIILSIMAGLTLLGGLMMSSLFWMIEENAEYDCYDEPDARPDGKCQDAPDWGWGIGVAAVPAAVFIGSAIALGRVGKPRGPRSPAAPRGSLADIWLARL